MLRHILVLLLVAVVAQATVTPLTYYVKNYQDDYYNWNVSEKVCTCLVVDGAIIDSYITSAE
tara:strand:- start:323 stop:508 length:186 start_codon:yes stop_codon:yes gene_type:complete